MSRLILRSSDIISGGVTGTVNASGTVMTWQKINWRLILGDDIYLKYNKFALVLESVYQTSANTPTAAVDGLNVIQIGGLPFVCGNYDPVLGLTRYVPILHFNWYNNSYAILSYFNECPVMFYKSETSPLEMNITRISDNVAASASGQTTWSFIFSVRPVE